VNGAALGIGSVGLLLTGTPLAWVIEQFSWRWGFVALSALALVAWLAIFFFLREDEGDASQRHRVDVVAALRGYGELFRLPHTLGIFLLALTTYASFMTLRGLWLGPMLIDRHAFSLVQAGNAAIAISVIGMFAAPLFGRLDPGEARRRSWIVACTLATAACFAAMALGPGAGAEVALAMLVGLLSGFGSLLYADVRSAYPPHMTGRAMAMFTMSMFLGVALMQWLTGGVASLAAADRIEPYAAVLGAVALALGLGCLAFRILPAPTRATAAAGSAD
jgi:predicted MFS family arabinose efflux permease